MNDLEPFAKLALALEPWRGQLVFIGGWAHRLHRFGPRASKLEHQPVFTRDTDLAFANRALIEGDMKAALLERGFKEELQARLLRSGRTCMTPSQKPQRVNGQAG